MINYIDFENNLLFKIRDYFTDTVFEKVAILPFKYSTEPGKLAITFNDIIGVPQSAILMNDENCVQMNPKFLKKGFSYCVENNLNFGIMHNHTNKFNIFSPQDLRIENSLSNIAFKITDSVILGNLLFCNNTINFRFILKSNYLLHIDKAFINNQKCKFENNSIIIDLNELYSNN